MSDTIPTTAEESRSSKPGWTPALVWSALGAIGWLVMVAILITLVAIVAALLCVFNLDLGALVLAGGLYAIRIIARDVTAAHPRDCWSELDPR